MSRLNREETPTLCCNPKVFQGFLEPRAPQIVATGKLYRFFSPAPSFPFLFFALSFCFLPLRSLFLRPPMPPFKHSAYLAKNPSSLSASTTVDNLIFSPFSRCSFDLPFVARMRTGRGEVGWRSASGSEDGVEVGEEWERRFWVR